MSTPSLFAPFHQPKRAAPYTLGAQRATYRISCRGVRRDPDAYADLANVAAGRGRLFAAIQTGRDLPRPFPFRFNAAVRRQPCSVFYGDLPSAALAETRAEPKQNPPFVVYGDVRLRLQAAGVEAWLDEHGAVETTFQPWGVQHRIDPELAQPLSIACETLLVGDCGLLVEVRVTGEAARPVSGELSLWLGGLGVYPPGDQPEYILVEPRHEQDDLLQIEGRRLRGRDPALPDDCLAEAEGGTAPELVEQQHGVHRRGVFRLRFDSAAGPARIRLLVQRVAPGAGPTLALADLDTLVAEAKAHYDRLLATARVTTPDALLNAGFDAALLTLDACRHLGAWLEGVHEWNCFFSCNYPISAATTLGRPGEAATALRFFSGSTDGPGAGYLADGQSFGSLWGRPGPDGTKRSNHYDALPYHIFQLHRHWQATGDLDTVRAVWAPTVANLQHNLTVDDALGNGLQHHHLGCNCFLYQFDNLQLAGAAMSPSTAVAGSLRRMAELAEALGEPERAHAWRRRATHLQHEILRLLWLPGQGRFAAALDPQLHHMQARGYTDDCFPALYADLPAEETWLALQANRRDLWSADCLMRTGDYLPEMFGNSLPQPAQMAEAAEAFAAVGEAQSAWALLHGTARSATIFTDSPGACCEFQTITGFGVADWLFAQPAGAYLQAVAGGLFGLSRRATGPLLWQPAIPVDWPQAAIELTGIRAEIRGPITDRVFSLTLAQAQALHLRLPRQGRTVTALLDGAGNPLPHRLVGSPAGGWVVVELPAAGTHLVRMRLGAAEPALELPATAEAGAVCDWPLPSLGWRWRDPQHLLAEARECDGRLRGRLASSAADGVLFLVSPDGARVVPHHLRIGPAAAPPAVGPLVLAGSRRAVDLSGLRNSDAILQKNWWRCSESTFDLRPLAEPATGMFVNGPYRFTIADRSPCLIRLDAGGYHGETGKVSQSERWDDRCRIAIGGHVAGLEFLVAADSPCRVTGMAVVVLRLLYADGGETTVPLTWGGELGSSTMPFGTRCSHRELHHLQHVCAFAIAADPARALAAVEVHCAVADLNLGVLALNAVGG